MYAIRTAAASSATVRELLYIAIWMHTVFGEEREHLQDLGFDGKLILNIILGTYVGDGGGWVAQDRLERRTLINTKIKIIHKAIKY